MRKRIITAVVSVTALIALCIGILPMFATQTKGASLFYNEELELFGDALTYREYDGECFVPVDLFGTVPYIDLKIDTDQSTFIMKNTETDTYISALCLLDRALVNGEVVTLKTNTEVVAGDIIYYVPLDYISTLMGVSHEMYTMPSGKTAVRIYDRDSVMSFEALLRATSPEEFEGVPVVPPTGDSHKVRVAVLGFGPESAAVMDKLNEAGIRACFFVDEDDISSYPEVLVRAVCEGFEIGIVAETGADAKRINDIIYAYTKMRTHLVMGCEAACCATVTSTLDTAAFASYADYISGSLAEKSSVILLDGRTKAQESLLILTDSLKDHDDIYSVPFGIAYGE